MNRSALVLLLAVALLACGRPEIYQSDVPLPESGWVRGLRPTFCFGITDTVTPHDVFIDVRHTGDYAYSDLYLFVDIIAPDGRILRDTVECLLADPMGRWYGRGTGFVFADRFKAHVLYKLGDRFPRTGRYCLRMEQAMRTDTLHDVLDIGINIAPSQAAPPPPRR
ncbi:MAG: gliding motility lipoprotein GldH [Flavobacteriales bacterium]|nr:gliding motility lipoprotein GldH [Flavobacteriales bacterium]